MTSLRDSAAAPGAVPGAAPGASPGLIWRPLAVADAGLWADLLEAITRRDGGHEHFSAEDLVEELAPDWIDLAADSVLAVDGEGRARAFGLVQLRPGDLLVLPFDEELARDPGLDERVRLAHNEAFADHWGSQPQAPEAWRSWFTGGRSFRGGWSFVVRDGDEVAGYALSAAHEADWAVWGFTEGWTQVLGVRRPWRGRGVATALLSASMHAFAAAGLDHAGLDVDAENWSGAVSLYTGLGYQVIHRSAFWAKDV